MVDEKQDRLPDEKQSAVPCFSILPNKGSFLCSFSVGLLALFEAEAVAQPPPLNRAALFDMLPIPELTQDILKKIPEDIQFQNIYDWARFRATATLVLFVKVYKTSF